MRPMINGRLLVAVLGAVAVLVSAGCSSSGDADPGSSSAGAQAAQTQPGRKEAESDPAGATTSGATGPVSVADLAGKKFAVTFSDGQTGNVLTLEAGGTATIDSDSFRDGTWTLSGELTVSFGFNGKRLSMRTSSPSLPSMKLAAAPDNTSSFTGMDLVAS